MAHRLVDLAIIHHDALHIHIGLSFQLSCARHLVRDKTLHHAITFLHRSVVPTPIVPFPLGCSTPRSAMPTIAARSPTSSDGAPSNACPVVPLWWSSRCGISHTPNINLHPYGVTSCCATCCTCATPRVTHEQLEQQRRTVLRSLDDFHKFWLRNVECLLRDAMVVVTSFLTTAVFVVAWR